MNKIKKYVLTALPAVLMLASHIGQNLSESKNIKIAFFLVFMESLIYYMMLGLSKLYNPEINFEKTPEYNRVVSALIIGVHVMVSIIMLGVYFDF